MKGGSITERSEAETTLGWHARLADKVKQAVRCDEISGIKLILSLGRRSLNMHPPEYKLSADTSLTEVQVSVEG